MDFVVWPYQIMFWLPQQDEPQSSRVERKISLTERSIPYGLQTVDVWYHTLIAITGYDDTIAPKPIEYLTDWVFLQMCN